ncbi:MAG: hypothetical protein WBO55_10275 [Rhizobiaceae bacterium]
MIQKRIAQKPKTIQVSFNCTPTADEYEDLMAAINRARATNVKVVGEAPYLPPMRKKVSVAKKTVKKTPGKKIMRKG